MSKSLNFAAQLVSVPITVTANTEFAVAHGLKATPLGYFIAGQTRAGKLYRSTTAWTALVAYFKCTASGGTFTVLFFA